VIKADMDMNGAARQALPSKDVLLAAQAAIATAARHKWIKFAKQQLKSSSREYIQAISPVEQKGQVHTITLIGSFPNMLEHGASPYDMRETLLGPGAKNRKQIGGKDDDAAQKGWYNTVPFGHGSPGSGETNVGPQMPESIHQLAKKLAPTRSMTKGARYKTAYGERLHHNMDQITPKARELLTRRTTAASGYTHKSSVYSGMIRGAQQTRGANGQFGGLKTSGYTTFRRISTNSDPKSWQHPGIKAAHMVPKVEKYIKKIMMPTVRQFMEGKNNGP
jgi:hypothetical protein